MGQLDQIASEVAGNLDAGKREAASNTLSQYASSLQREDFRTLVKSVDSQEHDGQGLDMTVKITTNGVPEHYAVLPAVEHGSAKLMAQLMDDGKGVEAQVLMNQVMAAISQRNALDNNATVKDFRLWAMAVDTYEKEGIGGDVAIGLKNPSISSVNWQMEIASLAGPIPSKKGGDTIAIPSLILDKPAVETDTVAVPVGSDQARVYEEVRPSVVALRAKRSGPVAGTEDISMGSGFVVGNDGLIATNDHTVFNFDEITVLTEDRAKSYVAKVVAEDQANDIALLKVEPKVAHQFVPLALEPSSGVLTMEQPLMALGYAKGWAKVHMSQGTVVGATMIGQVAAVPNPPGEDLKKSVVVLHAHGEDGGSGGPVINENGKVVGLAELAADSGRGQHIFMTRVDPLIDLIKKYRGK